MRSTEQSVYQKRQNRFLMFASGGMIQKEKRVIPPFLGMKFPMAYSVL